MYTYKVGFHGMNSEAMVKTMDKIFRRWYNVYGGYRAMTTKDSVIMTYTAKWNKQGFVPDFKTIENCTWAACGRQKLIDDDNWFEVIG